MKKTFPEKQTEIQKDRHAVITAYGSRKPGPLLRPGADHEVRSLAPPNAAFTSVSVHQQIVEAGPTKGARTPHEGGTK